MKIKQLPDFGITIEKLLLKKRTIVNLSDNDLIAIDGGSLNPAPSTCCCLPSILEYIIVYR